jgi:hypothetical protein
LGRFSVRMRVATATRNDVRLATAKRNTRAPRPGRRKATPRPHLHNHCVAQLIRHDATEAVPLAVDQPEDGGGAGVGRGAAAADEGGAGGGVGGQESERGAQLGRLVGVLR